MKCRFCGAIETEENPVERESEECSACAHERMLEHAPHGHPYRNVETPPREFLNLLAVGGI